MGTILQLFPMYLVMRQPRQLSSRRRHMSLITDPKDLFYWLALESLIIGVLHPILRVYFWNDCGVFHVERRPYLLISVLIVFFKQWMPVPLPRAQTFTIFCRIQVVGFRASRDIPLSDYPLEFTPKIQYAFHYATQQQFFCPCWGPA